jgi:hypothetical protein
LNQDLEAVELIMLSRHEKQELDRIEEWFLTADPRLARNLGEHSAPRSSVSGAHTAIFCGYLLAAFLTVAGLATATLPLIFFGVVALITAGAAHISTRDVCDEHGS